jgi:4-hydroxy-3-methylbut-2-enyl diphosphate reductase
LKLQNRVKHAFDKIQDQKGQIVIYGKEGHAEVVGLTGQTRQEAIVIMEDQDLDKIDFTKPITLFSQTTKSTKGFYRIKELIQQRIEKERGNQGAVEFIANDSICRQVSNREPQLRQFSTLHDIVIFVSGKKSSNGKALYNVCKEQNPRSYFIENEHDLDLSWFNAGDSVGICGATSTPMWLMKQVADYVELNHTQLAT